MTLLERVLASPPHWANDLIQPFDEDLLTHYSAFINEEEWTANGCINVFGVTGTRLPAYQGWTWLKFLQEGRRMVARRQDFEANPAYYECHDKKEPTMSYISDDGSNWFLDGDGNHRTCIARFSFAEHNKTTLHGVELTRITLNKELIALCQLLQTEIMRNKLAYNVIGKRSMLKRIDAAGWKKDLFDTFLVVNGVSHLSLSEAKEWLKDLQKPRLFNFFTNLSSKNYESNNKDNKE